MCQLVWLWFLLVTLTAGAPEEHQYCAIRYRRLCQGKGRHVACQFPDSGPGSSCERYTPIKFTNDLKHFITHYLNRRRQRIAAGNERVRGGVHLPKPQIMMLVEWDRELSQLAQRLADQCHFVHDDCRATVKYPYAGQTVGEVRWRRSSDSDELSAQRAIRRVLDAWWGERRRVQSKQLTAPFRLTAKGTVWGHFSQLAVWNLQAVGCGAVRHGAHHPRLLLVCDFSHTNMLGQRTIVPGAMAPCPIHTARRPRSAYPLLCGPVRHPAPQEREEMEAQEYDDDDDESDEAETVEVGDVPSPTLWQKRTESYRTPSRAYTHMSGLRPPVRESPDVVSRQQDSGLYRGDIEKFTESVTSPVVNKDPIREKTNREKATDQDLDRDKDGEEFRDTEDDMDRERIRDGEQIRDRVPNKEPVRKTEHIRHMDRFIDRNIDRDRDTDLVMDEQARRKAIFKQDKNYNPLLEHTDWPTKKQSFERPYGRRQGNENPPVEKERDLEQVIPLTMTRRVPTQAQEPRMVEVYRPTIREDIEATEADSEAMYSRWQQTRFRPKRPGANALLYTSTIKQTKKPALSVIKLDKEDIDQLFRDTGFNLDWRKQTT